MHWPDPSIPAQLYADYLKFRECYNSILAFLLAACVSARPCSKCVGAQCTSLANISETAPIWTRLRRPCSVQKPKILPLDFKEFRCHASLRLNIFRWRSDWAVQGDRFTYMARHIQPESHPALCCHGGPQVDWPWSHSMSWKVKALHWSFGFWAVDRECKLT